MKQSVEIRAIHTKKQYTQYLSIIDELMDEDPAPSSESGQLLETLSILVDEYEKRQGWELPFPKNPVEVIKSRMVELDLKQVDLAEAIGDKTVVSRILNGSRKLTYSMVKPLSDLLKVPAEFLLEKA
jgi:HTH-type transcriptional regulator / antitoxin HigA